MNIIRIAVLIVAALAALAAAFFVRGAMQPAAALARPGGGGPGAEPARVLVAARDIAPGERVASGDFRWTAWPEEAVLPSYLNQADVLTRSKPSPALLRAQASPRRAGQRRQAGPAGRGGLYGRGFDPGHARGRCADLRPLRRGRFHPAQ
jgi:pilus assembly protein CpaB